MGEISLIMIGAMTENAPHPHPINSLPRSNAQKLNIMFIAAPMIIIRFTASIQLRLPNDKNGEIVNEPIIVPKIIIVVTTELKVSLFSM